MRSTGNTDWVHGMVCVAALASGCGAAPRDGDSTVGGVVASSSLRALEVSNPEARLLSREATRATFEIRVLVTHENEDAVTIRHVRGTLSFDGLEVATLQIEGPQQLDADAERVFVFEVHVPLSLLATVRGDTFTVRGALVADGGSGDGALVTPFEFTEPIPR